MPARAEGRSQDGDRRRHQPVRDHVGSAGLPGSDRREVRAYVRDGRRPQHAALRHLRVDRGDDRRHHGHRRSRRRGRRLRAVLRELRARCHPVRRHAAVRDAARTRLDLRRGRARGGVQRADARHHPQHAEQPDGEGVHASRAGIDRETLRDLGRRRVHRRDLRTHDLRRTRARPAHHRPRYGGSDGHDQRPVEDLLGHGMAGRVDDRVARADERDPQGPRLPDRRRGRAAAGGGRRRDGPSRRLLHAAGRRVPRAPRSHARDPRGRGVQDLQTLRRVLHHDRHLWTRVRRRRRSRAPADGRCGRGVGARLVVLLTTGARPHEAPFLVLQTPGDAPRRGRAAGDAETLFSSTGGPSDPGSVCA